MSEPSFQRILTHPGGAHKDDLLACCVLLAENPVAIERREPSEADLANPAIAVVDVGDQHAPERGNFDHHQLPREHPPTCSLSLVLQRLGIYEDAKRFCEWLEPAEWFDSRGANRTAAWLGVERDIVGKLNSPIDATLMRRFAAAAAHLPGEPVWEMMRLVGQDLVAYVRGLRQRLDFIDAHKQLWDIDSPSGASRLFLFLPRTDPLPEDPSSGIGHYLRQQGLEERVVGMVYPDRRSPGYGLSRYNDHPSLDFTRVRDQPDVHFAHQSGFVAKSTATDPRRLKLLARGALLD